MYARPASEVGRHAVRLPVLLCGSRDVDGRVLKRQVRNECHIGLEIAAAIQRRSEVDRASRGLNRDAGGRV